MKSITGVLATFTMLALVACTSGDGTVAIESTPDESVSTVRTPVEADFEETPQEVFSSEQDGGITGCDLIRDDLTTWLKETKADTATANVVQILDSIAPLVNKPSRRTEKNLRKVGAIINSDLAKAVQAVPNSPMKEVSATDVDACEDDELIVAYDIARRPLRDRVNFVMSYKILGVDSAGKEIQQLIEFGTIGNQALRKIAGDRVNRSLNRAKRELAPVVDALSLPGLSEE